DPWGTQPTAHHRLTVHQPDRHGRLQAWQLGRLGQLPAVHRPHPNVLNKPDWNDGSDRNHRSWWNHDWSWRNHDWSWWNHDGSGRTHDWSWWTHDRRTPGRQHRCGEHADDPGHQTVAAGGARADRWVG